MPPRLLEIGAAFILSSLYVPFIIGAATSPRWCFLSLVLPLGLLYFRENILFTRVHLVLIAFFLYACVSLKWSYNDQATYELVKFLILLEAFVLGSFCLDLRFIFIGLALGISLSSIIVVFGLSGGLFINTNTLSETSLLVLIGVCIYKMWWYVPFILPSFLININRTALLTLSLLIVVWVWQKHKILALVFILFTFVILLTSIQLNYRIESLQERLTIWKTLINNLTFLGNGIGSFSLFSYYNIVPYRPMFAHNDFLQIVFELGMIGGILIVTFFTLIINSYGNEKYIVWAFIFISCFDFPTHLPVSAFIVFLVSGYTTRNRSCLYNFDWTSGMVLLSKDLKNNRKDYHNGC